MDYSRHYTVFDPDKWGNKRVDIVGCGATGSRIAMEIARLGVENIHLHDFDTVGEHNLANQLFTMSDIGELKTVALAHHIEAISGIPPVIHGKADGDTSFGNVVFLLTDTVESRKEIFTDALRLNNQVELVIETRLGSIDFRVYSFNPNNLKHGSLWWSLLPGDDAIAEVSLCGTPISIGATAAALAGFSVWSFMQFARDEKFPNEVIGGMPIPSFIVNYWE